MDIRKKPGFILMIISFLLISSVPVFAGKTEVKISGPSENPKNLPFTIVIHVKHNKNTKFHHPRVVKLKVNGKTVKKWVYTRKNLAPGAEFDVMYTLTLDKDCKIKAKSRCNWFGKKGTDQIPVKMTNPD